MKWYTTENTQGREDYSAADSMFAFTSQHRISVHGHNIFWNDPQYQPWWVKNLSPQSLGPATDKRLYSAVSTMRIYNENLHFNFYESKLGGGITNKFFQKPRQLDRRAKLFMNDYNTIEDGRDSTSSPSKYIVKLRQLQGVTPDVLAYNALFDGYCLCGKMDKARDLIDLMVQTYCRPNIVTCSTLMNGYAKLESIDKAIYCQ